MFDPRMLQDPILRALLSQLGQQQQQPTGGMGAQSNPNIFQDPSGVYRNIQPSNEPPALPIAAPGDYATEQFLAQLAAEQAAQSSVVNKQAEREHELRKIQEQYQAPKLIDSEIERLKIAATKSKDEAERTSGLDKTYIEALGKIGGSGSPTAQQEIETLKGIYRELRAPKSAPKVDPVKALTGEIDRLRKSGKSDIEIREQLIMDAEQNPQFADAARSALEYMDKTTQLVKPTYLPSRTSRSAGVSAGERTIPKVTPQTFGEISQANKGKGIVESLQDIERTGGKRIPPESIESVIAQAKKTYQNVGRTGYSFPEWVARNVFGTIDYDKVEQLIRVVEGA